MQEMPSNRQGDTENAQLTATVHEIIETASEEKEEFLGMIATPASVGEHTQDVLREESKLP